MCLKLERDGDRGSRASAIAFLRSCAADLGVNFDEVIAGIPESERRRMDEMLKLKKDDRWKQATPMDQLTVILMSLEGWMDLVDPAFVDAEKLLEKVKEHVDQLVALKPFLQQWHW